MGNGKMGHAIHLPLTKISPSVFNIFPLPFLLQLLHNLLEKMIDQSLFNIL